MANSLDFGSKSRHRKTPNSLQAPPCRRSRLVVADVVIFVAVITAFGFLLFPYAQFVASESVKIGVVVVNLIKEEVSVNLGCGQKGCGVPEVRGRRCKFKNFIFLRVI
uniref:Uncharacterized protein n=1 Tax=Cajanus cajan TaxID=3821 RepID=A0A151TEY7_CAJCA|nr:hypothetical protein KK1_011854 [Cajanus cajan]